MTSCKNVCCLLWFIILTVTQASYKNKETFSRCCWCIFYHPCMYFKLENRNVMTGMNLIGSYSIYCNNQIKLSFKKDSIPGKNKNEPSGENVHRRKNDCMVSSINIRACLLFVTYNINMYSWTPFIRTLKGPRKKVRISRGSNKWG